MDSPSSTSLDLLPYGEFFQRVQKMSIIAATPAIWARDTAELKLYPSGRIWNREDLGLTYDVFDTEDRTHIDMLVGGEQKTRVEQYLAGDPMYQQIRKAFAVTQRNYSVVFCFKVVYHRWMRAGEQVGVLILGRKIIR